MPEQKNDRRLHFILTNTSHTELFKHPTSGPRKLQIPMPDRHAHGQRLLSQFYRLKSQTAEATQKQRDAGFDSGFGISIQFTSQPDIDLAFESLSKSRAKIELLNVRHEDNTTFATVFVPDGKLDVFEKIIQDYLADKRGKDGKSLDHKALVNTIREVRIATFDALYTDDPAVLPDDEEQAIWWEIWLPIRDNRSDTLTRFSTVATGIGFKLSSKVIKEALNKS